MTKIILSGCCGKMGKMVSECAKNFQNLSIVAGIDFKEDVALQYPIFDNILKCEISADVIIDFSRPSSLKDLGEYAISKNIPLVICTTGYSDKENQYITSLSKKIAVFHSANMSIGINVVNSLLRKVSALLYEDFDIEIIEKHHNQKVDSPSGTALLLANTIKNSIAEETEFIYGREGMKKREHKEIGIHAVRGGNIIGDHEIIFAGQGESIEIKHTAISREVFAVGALRAAAFVAEKPAGIYDMDNVVNK
ncbi:MAG: 4-hydroxy-tetrahydrodipicolinate reductase [Clostridium sp.]